MGLSEKTKSKQIGKLEIKNMTSDRADLFFYGDIVSSEWDKWENSDTCPQDVLDFLAQVENVKQIDLYINSGGGSVFAGMAIYNILKRNAAYKVAHIDGVAASIASILPFACQEIIFPSNAYLMIHKAWNIAIGNANDFRKMADSLDVIDEGILNIYEANLIEGASIDEVKAMVEKETWLTGDKVAGYFNVKLSESNDAAAYASDHFKNYTNIPENFKIKALVAQKKPVEQPAEPSAEPQNNDLDKAKAILALEAEI